MMNWNHNLHRLRGPGYRRGQKKKASTALQLLLKQRPPKGALILDLGCGDSADRFVAENRGYRTFGIDLYLPTSRARRDRFIQADLTKGLPFASGIVDGAYSHAVLSLIDPGKRLAFYLEVARVLKPAGKFSITAYPLADGFRATLAEENTRLVAAGFHVSRAGLYLRCNREPCEAHKFPQLSDPVPENGWQQIVQDIRQMDSDPEFVELASIFIALLDHDGDILATSLFSGEPLYKIVNVRNRAIAANVYDEATCTYIGAGSEDQEDGLGFMMDMLCLRGWMEKVA